MWMLVLSTLSFSISKASIPSEYIANYQINEDWENIVRLFVKIEANSKIGNEIEPSLFSELNTNFNNVFPHFPNDYSFELVYEQCLELSSQLSSGYNYNTLVSFMSNCHTPFNNIVKKINSQYTVVAKAKVSPSSWPAPLVVSFDARDSYDPSNETIPSQNFFWYYRDVDGNDKIIGEGPVISHTFEEPGNYIVHLTVRSSNYQSAGIFDGSHTLSVDVKPKAANIIVYANGQKMLMDKRVKIWVQEANKWIILDWSATIPMGGREILIHRWDVTSRNWFKFFQEWDAIPDIVRVILPDQWEYKISLTTLDNEWNQITETFSLAVSDPVAIIKQSPESGTTSSTYSFDANASYSVISSIRLYTREIFDETGEKLEMFQGKSIKQEFDKPGNYTVKLTVEDMLWKTNTDTIQVFVESTDPIPQYTTKSNTALLYPSQFIFDAKKTYDIDELKWYDNVSFDWKFSEPESVEIVQTEDKNKKILINFNEIWEHIVRLVAKDDYGKVWEIEKTLKVESTLRPELFIAPTATTWWSNVNFVVKSNQPIINYEWNFGDGKTNTVQTNKVTHIYQNAGVYTVTLKVIWTNDMENQITKKVFIWDKNSPIPGYVVKNEDGVIMTENDTCFELVDDDTIEHPAYKLDRYQKIILDTSDSVNIKWKNIDLAKYFQPKNDEIYKIDKFSHRFDEMWCSYIDYTVEDTTVGKNSKTRIWFKVVNDLPTLDNVVLEFPQFGNEIGIGMQQQNTKNIFEAVGGSDSFDPLIVKVVAQSPLDEDGVISYFKWYYYYKDDPVRRLETKITPSDTPYAFFSLPKVAGEYMFWVTMYDNDEWKQSSEEIIWHGPIVFFPPDTKKPDIPLVTLKVDKVNVEVGEQVTFDVVSKVVSDRPDFVKERTILYDYDGDGEWDYTTKKDRVTHIYTEPSEEWYNPRAAVLYRGYKGIGKGSKIVVKNGLKPRLLYDAHDNFVIFRDESIWDITKKDTCLSLVDCKKNTNYQLSGGKAFSFEYPEYKKYVVSMEIEDKHANNAKKNWPITLTAANNEEVMNVMSIPSMSNNDGNMEIFVWDNLNNAVLYYIKYDDYQWDECFVDADITVDSDLDGNDDNDRDFHCNELHFQKYEPRYQSIIWRIYYQVDTSVISKDFSVSFLDFELNIDPKLELVYKKLDQIINSIDTDIETNNNLRTFLLQLRDGLIDKIDTSANLVTMQNYITNNEVNLTEEEEEILEFVIDKLSNEATKAAQGENVYEQAKAEILSVLPENVATTVREQFKQFETTKGWMDENGNQLSQQERRKQILQVIINEILSNVAGSSEDIKEGQVDPIEMELNIMPNICKIMTYYSIPSATCSSEDIKAVPDTVEETDTSSGLPGWLKTLFIIIWILLIVFVWLVVVFAVKAKMRQAQEEAEWWQ